jgi:hypothetical protein
MPLSRDELRRKLRESLGNGDGNGEVKAEKAKPAKPAADNPFSRIRKPAKAVEVVEDEVEDTAVAVADEDEDEVEDSEIPSETHRTDEPEFTPVEELVDRVKDFIDFVVENGESLKSWLDTVR